MVEWSEAKSNLDCGPEDLSSNPGSFFSVEKELGSFASNGTSPLHVKDSKRVFVWSVVLLKLSDESSLDREVLGLIPATSELFS